MNQEQIEHYVAGRMSEAEALVFEDYCLANPEFARQVEYEQRLKSGLAQVASGSTAEFVRSESPLRWSLAAAAGLLIAVVAVLIPVEFRAACARAHHPGGGHRAARHRTASIAAPGAGPRLR